MNPVGERDGVTELVHYIAPHWDAARSLLSFGFVYIHPMSDGNGRISRFLINDVLRRDQAIPAPFILPVSAAITSSAVHRRRYDQVIEGPDGDIDRIIRSVRENSGKLSNKLLKEFPALAEHALAGELLEAIEAALAPPGNV